MNGLDYAIKMELDGRSYYLDQAEKSVSKELKSIFLMLADEERAHAELLQSKADDLPFELNDVYTELENEFRVLNDVHNDIKFAPDALDAYNFALEREREGAQTYKKLYDEAKDENEKRLYEYLLRQENEHISLVEELIRLISHSVEWVESAEFGLREEY